MPNHYHLILQPIEKDSLSKIMQVSLSKYSLYIHKKYSWPGHIFQSRFQCKLISDIKYFDALVLYIENNPTEAKLTDVHGNYRWLKLYDNKIAKQRELLSMGID
jgi:putative transposase